MLENMGAVAVRSLSDHVDQLKLERNAIGRNGNVRVDHDSACDGVVRIKCSGVAVERDSQRSTALSRFLSSHN